jgi:hypothetical protein
MKSLIEQGKLLILSVGQRAGNATVAFGRHLVWRTFSDQVH